MDFARRRTWIIAEVVAIAAAVAAGAFLGVRARGSDDDEPAAALPAVVAPTTTAAAPAMLLPPTTTAAPATTAPPATTAAPATTSPPMTTLAPATTATTAPATTTTTPATTTTAPPRQSPGDLEAALLAALPTAADLPEGWAPDPDGAAETGFVPSRTDGYCNGPNADQRALDAGAVAAVVFYAQQPNGEWYSLRLTGYDTAAAAQQYVDSTRTLIDSCDGSYWSTLPEGDGSEGTFDGFVGDDPEVTWGIASGVAQQDQQFTGVDDALRIVNLTTYSTTLDGVEYGWSDTRIVQLERIGRIVITHRVIGNHSLVGWTDAPGYDYEPTEQDLVEATIVFTQPLFRGLLDQALIELPA